MFGCCKTFFGKYIFFENANFRKRKMFPCVWLYFKKFSGKNFLVFGKEGGKHKPQPRKKKNHQFQKCFQSDDRDRDSRSRLRSCLLREITIDGAIAILPSIAPSDWSWSSRSRTGSSPLACARARSLSLSLIFWKCFEGKIEV